eukprot:5855870-Pleurochrysis_carterae.AAC.3
MSPCPLATQRTYPELPPLSHDVAVAGTVSAAGALFSAMATPSSFRPAARTRRPPRASPPLLHLHQASHGTLDTKWQKLTPNGLSKGLHCFVRMGVLLSLCLRSLALSSVHGVAIVFCGAWGFLFSKPLPRASTQVRNLSSCVKVALDFVSPENAHRCVQLTDEFAKLPRGHHLSEDKLQVLSLVRRREV